MQWKKEEELCKSSRDGLTGMWGAMRGLAWGLVMHQRQDYYLTLFKLTLTEQTRALVLHNSKHHIDVWEQRVLPHNHLLWPRFQNNLIHHRTKLARVLEKVEIGFISTSHRIWDLIQNWQQDVLTWLSSVCASKISLTGFDRRHFTILLLSMGLPSPVHPTDLARPTAALTGFFAIVQGFSADPLSNIILSNRLIPAM